MAHWRYLVLAMFLLAPALLPGSQKKAFILDELIPLALGHNPLLAAQRQEIQARKSALQASRVLLNQEFEYQRGRAEAWDKTEKRTTEEISLSQNFENPFKRHSRIQWYEKDWEAAQFELQVLSLDTIFSLKSLFYRILLLRTKQDLAQKNLESISRIHELIQKRVDLGEVKPLEAIKLYVEKLKAQNELSKVRTELLLEREKLNMLLGHTLPEDFSILGTLDYAPLDQEEGALIQKALAHHPKMKEMEARLLQARHRISFVRWQRLPDFTLTGFTEKELDGRNTGVGITLDIPLWNFRSREIHEAESLYEKQAEELRALRMALSTEIKARLNQVKLSEQTLAIFHEGLLKQAEESRKVAEMSYAQGEISLEEIEHRLEKYPGMTLNMTQPIAHNLDELITGVKAQLAVKIYGENFDILKQKALQVKDLLAQIRGASDVQVEQFTGQNHIQIVLQREKIARYGINISHIQETIEAAIGGIILGQIYEEQKRFDIFLRFQPEARKDIEQIRNLLIPIPGGGQVPLSQFASIQEAVGPRMISRENNKRFITIQCNIRGRDIGGFVAEAQKEIRANVPFPPEYMIKWGGQFELQQRANRRFAVIMPLTLALVTLLLFTIFYSFREVLIILINIPLALTGGILALKASGLYLSVPASIGFIAIFGIALENGLVLISAIRRLLKQGLPIKEAVFQGVSIKIRPVLMTSFTTIFGILPLLVARGPGAEIQRPLATVVVGGLFTSTLVTLIVLPLVYQTLKRPSEGS